MEHKQITIDNTRYRLVPEEEYTKYTKPRTGYEKIEGEGHYWRAYGNSAVGYSYCDETLYHSGDYCNDEQLAIDNARVDEIYRRMRQWQALNDKVVDIYNPNIEKHYIYCDASNKELCVGTIQFHIDNHVVYFSTVEKAKEALGVFRDDLIWLHTKYRRRLDEPVRS